MAQQTLHITTKHSRQIIDITSEVNQLFQNDTQPKQLCNISIAHTTAALTLADLDPGTDDDYLSFIEKLTPQINWNHAHDPSHTPDHIWSTIIGTHVTIPVENQTLKLGTWQRIVLIELDGPRERNLTVTTI